MEKILKTNMLGARKNKEEVRKSAVSKAVKLLAATAVMTVSAFAVNCFAADGSTAITTAKTLLSKAATAGGGLWAVWGLVTLGMSIKDSNGPGIGNAIWQILGGAIIIAAGVAINALDLAISA